MSNWQRIVKYFAIAFAACLIVGIAGGVLSAVGFLGRFLGDGEAEPGEMKTYEFRETVRNLDLEISAAQLTVQTGPALSVETDIPSVTVKENGDTLVIRENGSLFHRTETILTLILPEGFAFEKAKIETGAGKVVMADFIAKDLSLELGAGSARLSHISVTSSVKIEGGAGKLVIEDSTFCDMRLEMGVGELRFAAALTGNNKIEMGVGKADITLLGDRDDYRVHARKGIGEIRVDGKKLSDGDVLGAGKTDLEIEGGVGGVTVNFQG